VAAKDEVESQKDEKTAQKDEKKKEKEAEEREKHARKEMVVKSLGKILARGERGIAFRCKRDALKNFDYGGFTARSHSVIKQAKERLVALNELYSSKKGE
jgi:nucleosome binding factor SPN SPT16 subunit